MRRRVVALAACLFWAVSGFAETPLRRVSLSPDVTVRVGESLILPDHGVAIWDLDSGFEPTDLGPLPAAADVDGYHLFAATGDRLLSFDSRVELRGGLVADPADVVRYDGETYRLEFRATDARVPAGANVDAVTVDPEGLLLSFDTTVVIGEIVAQDEDLVLFAGSRVRLAFDGSAAGVPAGADLDAVHYVAGNRHLLVSFDIGLTLGGRSGFDRDVFEWDPENRRWEPAIDGAKWSERSPGVDLDALSALAEDEDGDGVAWFDDCDDLDRTVWAIPGEAHNLRLSHDPAANATTLSWFPPVAPGSTRVAYDVLKSPAAGDFASNTAECLVSETGETSAIDTTTPAPDGAQFFLVRGVNGCGNGDLGQQRPGRNCL